jgi:hypothetical protein
MGWKRDNPKEAEGFGLGRGSKAHPGSRALSGPPGFFGIGG